MDLYISKELFCSDISKCSIELQDEERKRCYSYLNHAESLLVAANNDYFYIDVISNLKRAVDHRVKLISKQYNIKPVSKLFDLKGTFETLAEFSLIRKLMVSKLLELRNCIEHQFQTAPSHDRCEEYIEFTWYFLRSTDYLAKELCTDIYFDAGESSHYFAELQLSIESGWNIELRACLPKKFYKDHSSSDFHPIEVIESKLGGTIIEQNEAKADIETDEYWNDLALDDIYIDNANVKCPELKRVIIREYFENI